ncbi:MAG: EAL domain-containing protein, partial [Gammaproteobacteria bacterium]|nr:EAL domain-containing protein [Gammaproteobacteria bacterium]
LTSDSIRQHGESISQSFHDNTLKETSYPIELSGKYSDGREFPLELSISKSAVGHNIIHSVFARDISERKEAEDRIRQLAYYDSLTELPNRQSFKIQTEQAIKLAIRNNRMGAVLFIDLDEFKRINDTLGHDIGDLLIKRVAQRLLEQIRDNDTVSHTTLQGVPSQNVARLGGDEFTILLTEIKHIDDAGLVAQRIRQNIDGAFNLNGYEVYVTASIGIAVFPNDGKDVDELLKNADTAMYHAKAVGKNNFQFYSEQMGANATEYLKLGAMLRKALTNNEMKLYYQPQISAATGKITGAEALLRWEQAELGMISPADFIPLAEDTGMILDIGDWVLRQACLDNAAWQDAGYPSIRVAINLSGLQFIQKDLHFKVQQALETAGLDPQYLELEITESIIMRNIDETISTLQSFRNMNLGISVDDFGTGYSSLSYLKKFPLETLKIDRSFVTDIPDDNDDVKITSAILAMARSLNLKVVGEGVETQAQAAFLRQHHCDLLQGYLYSKPLPKNEFEQLLASEKTWDLSENHDQG